MSSQPYYSDELVTLRHGDCLDLLRELPPHAVPSGRPYKMRRAIGRAA